MNSRLAWVTVLLFSASVVFGSVPEEKVKRWQERKNFMAKDSTEATVTFTHTVEFTSAKKPTRDQVLKAIDRQLWHLFGPLAEAKMYAAPKGDHQVSGVSQASKKSGTDDTWEVSYTYQGTMQIKNGPVKSFYLYLPVNPDTVYEDSAVGRRYPCTDDHYSSEGDFWYFWNPYKKGCRLEEGTHFTKFQPDNLVRIPNTRLSYPDYGRLADSAGKITVHFLMGLDEPKNNGKNRDPMDSNDVNAGTYRKIRQSLMKQMHFESAGAWSDDQIREVVPGDVKVRYLPYVETLTKETNRQVKVGNSVRKVKIEVRLFFGPSGIDEEDRSAFHYFYKDALEHGSVVIYDGHSGLGGHLDLETIESENGFKIRFNPNYQILFFNSCSSYTYYNLAYFARKETRSDPKGTKNLDILTNGLATSFYVLEGTNMALVQGIDLWASGRKPYRTYGDLAKAIDSSNLFGVNGDEDNPKSEKEVDKSTRG